MRSQHALRVLAIATIALAGSGSAKDAPAAAQGAASCLISPKCAAAVLSPAARYCPATVLLRARFHTLLS